MIMVGIALRVNMVIFLGIILVILVIKPEKLPAVHARVVKLIAQIVVIPAN